MNLALRICLLSLIFFLPLLSPNLGLGYEQIKVFFFIALTTLAGFIWILRAQFKKEKINFFQSLLSGHIIIFLQILLVTSLVGVNPVLSLLGQPPYYQGWLIYAYLGLFALLVAYAKISLLSWAKVLTLSSLMVSGLAIWDWISRHLFSQEVASYAGRVVGSFGQPNFLAGFLLLILPFSFFLFLKERRNWRRVGLIGIIGAIGGVIVSESRTTIFLLFLALVWAVLSKYFKGRWVWAILPLVISALLVSSLYFSARFSTGVAWQEIIEPLSLQNMASANPSDPVEKRFYIWPIAWKLIEQRPFLGSGLDTVDLRFAEYWRVNYHFLFEANNRPSAVLIRLKDLGISQTHNYSLDLMVFSGIAGFLSWGILVVLLLKKTTHWVIFFSLVLYLFWIQFQNQSIVHLAHFWLLLGIVESGVKDRG